MKYKNKACEIQLANAPEKLQEICVFFEQLAWVYKKEATVTRVKDAVQGDSGVHEAGRAVDFRDQIVDADGKPVFLFLPNETKVIVDSINSKYPRSDGKVVCIHHSFQGMPYHFHLQIPASWT